MNTDSTPESIETAEVAETAEVVKVEGRDPVGTAYLAPDGAMLRLSHYDSFVNFYTDTQGPELPVYHWFGPNGGAAGGITDLPEGSIRIVMPTPERPAEGSVFITGDGTVYRLRDYRSDWTAEPFTGEKTVPSYVINRPNGMSSNSDSLPADARLIWSPTPGHIEG